MITVRYFAAAEEAAGTAEERCRATSLDALRKTLVAEHPALGPILPRCALLVDGTRHDGDTDLQTATFVDVLPPFAGG